MGPSAKSFQKYGENRKIEKINIFQYYDFGLLFSTQKLRSVSPKLTDYFRINFLGISSKFCTSGQFLAQTLGFTDEFLGIPRIFRYVTNLNETVNIFKLNRF